MALLVVLLLLMLLHTLPVRSVRMFMHGQGRRHHGNASREAGRHPPVVVHDGVRVVHVSGGYMSMMTGTCVVHADADHVAVGAHARGARVVVRVRVQIVEAVTLLVRPGLSFEGWRVYSLSR